MGESYNLEFFYPMFIILVVILILGKHFYWVDSPAAPEEMPPERPADVNILPPPDQEITLRVILPNAETHTCTLPATSQVSILKERVFPEAQQNVVLVYMGRRLRDEDLIWTCGIRDNAVIHAQRLSGEVRREAVNDQGTWFPVVAIGVILGTSWGLYLEYPKLFGRLSQMFLIIFTLLWTLHAKRLILG